MIRKFNAINIQFPISKLILEGSKIVETRTYPLPSKYMGVPLLFIETPGKKGLFKSRIVGLIVFRRCFQYRDETSFYSDFNRHRVEQTSQWAWSPNKPKWGWEIEEVRTFINPLPPSKRLGIKFTRNIRVPISIAFNSIRFH